MYAHLTAPSACCEAGPIGGLTTVSFGAAAGLLGAGSCPSTRCASEALQSVLIVFLSCRNKSLRVRVCGSAAVSMWDEARGDSNNVLRTMRERTGSKKI